jgi:cell division protein FtsB
MSSSSKYRGRGIGRKLLLIAVFLGLIGIFTYGDYGLYKWYKMRQLRDTVQMHNDSLKKANEELSTRIKAIEKGDSLEIERVARGYGMIRPGDEVYKIKPENPDTTKPNPNPK